MNTVSGRVLVTDGDPDTRIFQPQILGDLTRGNRIGFLGDSITIQDPASNAVLTEYHVRLVLKSGGRIEWGKKAGAGGATTSTIRATYLPLILNNAIKPDRVIVLAGTNDIGTGTFETARDNLKYIYQSLRAANIEPILCTLTPRPGITVSQRLIYDKLCHWIAWYAAECGYPLIDFQTAMSDDTGGWLVPGWTTDNIHPSNPSGVDKMADVAWSALQPYLLPSSPVLPVSNSDVLGLTNPLFLTDSNADGIPDGWSLNSAAGGTKQIIDAGVDAAGNWFEISKNTVGLLNYVSATIPASAGDRIRAGIRYMTTGIVGASGLTVEAQVIGGSGSVRLLSGGNVDLVPGTMITEFICPSGTTGVRFQYNVNPPSGGSITARIAQPLLLNLTTLGMA